MKNYHIIFVCFYHFVFLFIYFRQIGQNVISRRRKTDRLGKGLRHFSMKVCEKVKEKGKTTYNEVADELVTEEVQGQPIDPANYDQKNIRRRVYDALNVLMAMNIISKDKKEIRWIGLPTNSAQVILYYYYCFLLLHCYNIIIIIL